MENIYEIVTYIVGQSVKLKNKYVGELPIKIEFCDIFAHDENEFQQLTKVIGKFGNIVYPGPTGNIYLLKKPINTIAGDLYYLKIRKPDAKLHLRGDSDFDTEYTKLKQKFQNHTNFELLVREKFEMLRLSDPDFDVMTCFSNIPVRKWI